MFDKKYLLFFSILVLFLFSGCLSKVSYVRYRPAPINSSDTREICAFYLFSPKMDSQTMTEGDMGNYLWNLFHSQRFSSLSEQRRVQERMVAYGNERLQDRVHQSNYFTPRSPQPLKSTLGFPSYSSASMAKLLGAEGALIGKIVSMNWKEIQEGEEEMQVDSSGAKQMVPVVYLRRDYYFTVQYEMINFSRNRIFASQSFSQSTFDRVKITEQNELRDPDDLFSSWLDNSATQFIRQLVPQRVQETLYLQNNWDFRELFSKAERLVRSKKNQDAYALYFSLWKEHQVEAAGYNASLLLEAESRLFDSIQLMEAVERIYPTRHNKKRLQHLNEMAKEFLVVKSQL